MINTDNKSQVINSPRVLAFRLLSDWMKNGTYPNLALNDALSKSSMAKNDKALASAIVMGVVQNVILLDYYIQQVSSMKLKKIAPAVLIILRIGTFSLKFLDRIPKSAVCDESVKLSKKYCHSGSIKFVNAVMRSMSVKLEQIQLPNEEDGPIRFLSVKYSICESLCLEIVNELGREAAQKMLEYANTVKLDCLAVNTLKISTEALTETLQNSGVQVNASKLVKDAFLVKNLSGLQENKSFQQGEFYMQDEAAQIAALSLCPKAGDIIFDMCAAPGGKSFKIAIEVQNKAQITAFDHFPHKVKLISDGASRLGLSSIQSSPADASVFIKEFENKCDKIICDVPCSGIGLISKKPDIKLKERIEFEGLPELQLNILQNAAKYLKVGGVLVYSTCTIFKRENSDVISAFLANNKNFNLSDEKMVFGNISFTGEKTFLPHIDHTDGFFIARLVRLK